VSIATCRYDFLWEFVPNALYSVTVHVTNAVLMRMQSDRIAELT